MINILKEKINALAGKGVRVATIVIFEGMIGFYLLFSVFDIFLYSKYIIFLLVIKFVGIAFMISMQVIALKGKEENIYIPMLLAFIVAALGVTLKCFFIGEGFACQYYVGVSLVIAGMSGAAILRMKPKYFIGTLIMILSQHFLILSLIPFTAQDFVKNIVVLGTASLVCMLVYVILFFLCNEIVMLQGFIPICAKCRQIRDDDGYWKRIENYMSTHGGPQFTHGLCPNCAKELGYTDD